MVAYIRDLTRAESQRLSRLLKRSNDVVMVRRAQVIAFSGQGMRPREIAKNLRLHEEYVRELIRRFNAGSFEAIEPGKPTGRPSTILPEQEALIVETALSRPKDLGLPFTVWSLRKLAQYLVKKKVVKTIAIASLSAMLARHDVTYRRTKTWKESNDPEFVAKKNASRRSTRARRSADS